jgi:hypothetical protein
MSATADRTRFERRNKRVRAHKRDRVLFAEEKSPELRGWLYRFQSDTVNEATVADPACADFLEWWADEWKKYGTEIAPALAALYWRWSDVDPVTKRRTLDHDTFDREREDLADATKSEWLDGDYCSGHTLVQELTWWAQADWPMLDFMVEALDEFSEFHARGKMPDWRRRKRRRLAAARRKEIKHLYEDTLLPPPGDGILAAKAKSR